MSRNTVTDSQTIADLWSEFYETWTRTLSYRKDWDEARKTFALRPRQDWASHAADALRYRALGLRPKRLAKRPPAMIKAPVYSFTRSEVPARLRRY